MRSRKFLALLFCLITFPALAGYMTLLGAGVGSIAPVASWVSTTDPTFPSSSLTFSSTSLATMFDSTGKLTYAPNNLLTQSNTFTDASWSKFNVTISSGVSDPIGGTAAFTATATGAGAQLFKITLIGNALNTNFLNSIYVRRRTGSGPVRLYTPANTLPATLGVSASWQQFSATSIGYNTGDRFYFVLEISTSGDAVDIYASTGSAVIYETSPRTADQVITTSSAYYGPRIDYDPNTLAVKGLLIEEARTNYWLNSNSPASWSPISASQLVTANATTSPDGTSNASLIYIANGTGLLAGYNPRPSLPAGNSTLTIFAKQAAWKYLFIGLLTGATDYAVVQFDVSTGAVQRQAATGANFTIVGTPTATLLNNGWYRLQVVVNSVPANPFAFVMPYGTAWSAGAPPYNNATGDGSSGVYVYGVQGEPGAFGTSYTAAAASSVTRAADVVQFIGAALTALQGSAGSAIVETTDSQNTSAMLIGANTLSDYRLFWDSSAAKNYNGTYLISGAANPANPARAALAWSAAGRSIVANGGTVSTDGTPIVQGAAPFYLGAYSGSLYNPNAHFKSFAIYNQRLPDATLQAKSVVGASYAANDNGLRFADNDNLPIHWRVAL